MEKKEYIYQLLQKSEKDFESNNVLDAKMGIENLREKYQLYVEYNIKKGIEDAEARRVVSHKDVKKMFCK